MADRQRLDREDVEAGTGDAARRQRLDQRRLVDERTAGGVDEVCGRFHQAEFGGADDTARTLRQDQVNGDDVGTAEQVVLGGVFDTRLSTLVRRQILAPGAYPHAECLRHLGDTETELAETDDTEREPFEVSAERHLPWLTRFHAPVLEADPPRQLKDQAEGAAPSAAKAPEQPIEKLLASASVEKGQAAAKQCQSCHTFEKGGANRVGPNLWGIVGRPKASVAGFNYSAAMKAKGGNWSFDDLNKFLASPRGFIQGTNMSFAGLARDSQRADLIGYLRAQADSPVPLPKAAENAPAGGAPANKPAEAPKN